MRFKVTLRSRSRLGGVSYASGGHRGIDYFVDAAHQGEAEAIATRNFCQDYQADALFGGEPQVIAVLELRDPTPPNFDR